MLVRADADAHEIRRGADEYAVSVLVGLEGDVVRTLQSIKKGIELLDERRAAYDTDRDGDDGTDGVGVEEEDVERTSQPAAR